MANIDLLRHEIDRFGIVTVMDVTIYDIMKGNPVLFLDTLKISNINAEGQAKDIRGGKYADLLLTYDFGRSIALEFQDALLSVASMKQLWGAKQNEVVSAHGHEVLELSATNTVTLVKTDATILGVMNLEDGEAFTLAADTDYPENGEYTIDAQVITLVSDNVTEGDSIRVDFTYDVAGEDQASEIVMTSSSFPKTVKMVGRTFVLNQQNGQMVELEIEIPKLKLASNFTLTLDAEGEASVFDFSGMALINGADKELIKIKTLGYSETV